MTKDFADLDWTAAKAENARLRERERALIDELAEARRDAAASLSQRADLVEELAEAKVDKDEANDHIIACQEFLVKNGTQPGGDGSVVVGMVTLVERCDEQRERAETLEAKLAGALDARDEAVAALANARASALEEAARWHDAQAAELVIQFFPAHHRDALGGPVRAHDPEVFEEWAEHRRAATSIRALAKSPASGRFVANEVLEQARTAIEHLAFGLDPDDFPTAQARYAAQLKISEDALKALFPDWTAPRLDIALAALNAEKQR